MSDTATAFVRVDNQSDKDNLLPQCRPRCTERLLTFWADETSVGLILTWWRLDLICVYVTLLLLLWELRVARWACWKQFFRDSGEKRKTAHGVVDCSLVTLVELYQPSLAKDEISI